eukprot:5529947-Amphidinium_carterae.1
MARRFFKELFIQWFGGFARVIQIAPLWGAGTRNGVGLLWCVLASSLVASPLQFCQQHTECCSTFAKIALATSPCNLPAVGKPL